MQSSNDVIQDSPKLHDFLAQELVSLPSHTDGSRMAMFDHNLNQAVVLADGDFPNVFTGYERSVWGPNGYQLASHDLKIVAVVEKHQFCKMVFFQDSSGKLDCVEISEYKNFTENYGYRVNYNEKDFKPGNTIGKDSLIWHSSNFDNQLNPLFGKNLNVAYASWGNMTYEDAVVISKSASKAFATESVSVFYVTINTNDTLLPLYGENKSMPDIGSPINNGIIQTMRRWSAEELFTDFTSERMKRINPIKDTCIYGNGMVTDVTIYNNYPQQRWEQMLVNPQLQQMDDYMKKQSRYYIDCLDVMSKWIDNNQPTSDNVNFYYSRYKRSLNPDIKWKYDDREFDFIVAKITVAEKRPLTVGGKLVNRFGGKGCVSAILEDFDPDPKKQTELGRDMMPVSEDGMPIDVILNPLGIIGRMNPSSLMEVALNRIAGSVSRSVFENKRDISDLLGMLITLDPEWGNLASNMYRENPEFVKQSIGRYGPYIRLKPFYNNLNFNTLRGLYNAFPESHPSRMYVPYLKTFTKRRIVVGKMLIMRLKHDPETKFMSRGAGIVSPKGMPGKTKDHSRGTSQFNNNPIRMGEQELINLLYIFGNKPEQLRGMLNARSQNPEDRQTLAAALLTGQQNSLTPEDFDRTPNCNELGLKAFLTQIGLHFDKD